MGDPVLNDIEFDGDQSNLWTTHVDNDANQSNLRNIHIDKYVPKYTLKSKRLMHDYMFMYRCIACDCPMYEGNSLDEVLYNCHGYWRREEVNCHGYWRREEVHARCAVPRRELDKFVPIKDKAPNSGKTLLLLEYLGLPRDLSWLIIAAAYWLL
jgi:hypothetical protein